MPKKKDPAEKYKTIAISLRPDQEQRVREAAKERGRRTPVSEIFQDALDAYFRGPPSGSEAGGTKSRGKRSATRGAKSSGNVVNLKERRARLEAKQRRLEIEIEEQRRWRERSICSTDQRFDAHEVRLSLAVNQ